MFQINYCEFNRSNPDYDRIYRPYGSGDYLFLLLKTPMRFHLSGKQFISKEDACILFTPGTPQDYQAVRKFRNSYLHFSTDLNFEQTYRIPVNQLFYPSNLQEADHILQEIQQEYLSHHLYRENQMRCLTEQLFLLLSRSLYQPSYTHLLSEPDLLKQFQKLRLTMLKNYEEDWSIQRLCKEMNMEKSQFYYYYKLFFGTAPKAELLQIRMEKARYLLTNEALQIQQVAQACGFQNVQHFSRYFKSWYHCSPREYSKNVAVEKAGKKGCRKI